MHLYNLYSINSIIILIMTLIIIMINVAFLTLFERKILSYSHYRKGPNKVAIMGLLQPFSDALKLLSKEFFIPLKANFFFYLISPLMMFIFILMLWLIYPFNYNMLNWKMNIMFIISILSINIYSLIINGWSSNSIFSLLGSIRSIAQSISYEVTLSISILIFMILINSLNIMKLILYQKYLWLLFIMWPLSLNMLISMIAEINRTPFDLSEGESELVSGFNIEYSNYGFTLIFLSEYMSILFMMYLFNLMNFCSNILNMNFYFNLIMLLFLIIWMRASLPRIRYDYLMIFCWMYMLPMILILSIIYIIFFKFMIF